MKKLISVSTIVILICITIILFYPKKKVDKEGKLAEELSMLSYIRNGEASSEKPSKDLYIVNKIICDSGSNIIWDNINWELSFTKLESTDKCKIEFISKDSSSTDGRIVTIEEGKEYVDSYSKTTVDKGTIKFYPKSGYEIKSVSGCSNAIIEENKLIVNNVTKNETCNVVVEKGLGSFAKQILADNPTVSTRDSFTDIFTENTANTIYKATGEDGKTDVYYFAGGETESLKINNWVKFGQDKDGNNLYWRIIRTNADGGVRLLYAGSSNSASSGVPTMTNAYIGTSAYNSIATNSMYVGYMYGTSGSLANNRKNTKNSTIKEVIDTWYNSGLNAKSDGTNTYDKYISKGAVYCNDRAHSGTYYWTGTSMYYAAYERLVRNKTTKVEPTYVCGKDTNTGTALNTSSITSGSEDKFSVSTSQGGNGLLDYPIALMTADEVSYAGGLSDKNNSTSWYYYNAFMASTTGNTSWWTMTPCYFLLAGEYKAYVFNVDGSTYPGRFYSTSASLSKYGVRPVISLKSCVFVTGGNGSVASPYTVSIDNTCALQDE